MSNTVYNYLSSVLLGAWERVLNVSALIRNANSSTAAPSAYAASNTDPYDSGYEGDDEREPNPLT